MTAAPLPPSRVNAPVVDVVVEADKLLRVLADRIQLPRHLKTGEGPERHNKKKNKKRLRSYIKTQICSQSTQTKVHR
jgi:hypothetical protein